MHGLQNPTQRAWWPLARARRRLGIARTLKQRVAGALERVRAAVDTAAAKARNSARVREARKASQRRRKRAIANLERADRERQNRERRAASFELHRGSESSAV